MRITCLMCVATGLLVLGCSKKADETTEVGNDGTPTESAAAGTPAGGANPHLNAALSGVDSDIERKQYDAAIQKLLEAKIAAEASEADRKLYEAKYRETANALRQQAETDPQAKASYETLGRVMMGR